MWMEVLRDSVALAALFATLPFINSTRPDNPVWGLEILLWGQLLSSVVAWLATLIFTARFLQVRIRKLLAELLPYLGLTLSICFILVIIAWLFESPLATLIVQAVVAIVLYLGINWLAKSTIQHDAIAYILKHPLPSENPS